MRYCLEEYDFGVRDLTYNIAGSFHNYGRMNPYIKIDYIIADENTAKKPHSIVAWTDSVNGIYLSDHYPIALEIEL